MSGKEEDEKENIRIKDESIDELINKTYQFNKNRISTVKNVVSYSVDTLGNHQEIITSHPPNRTFNP